MTRKSWRFARIAHGGCWHVLLGLGPLPRPRDPAWSGPGGDAVAPQSGSNPEALWNSLWEETSLETRNFEEFRERLRHVTGLTEADLSKEVFAAASCPKAMEIVTKEMGEQWKAKLKQRLNVNVAPKSERRNHAIRLVALSARRYESSAPALGARSYLEASLFVHNPTRQARWADAQRCISTLKDQGHDWRRISAYRDMIGWFTGNLLVDPADLSVRLANAATSTSTQC